jgi:MoxR-like ATPase
MSLLKVAEIYSGQGQPLYEREPGSALPTFSEEGWDKLHDPAGYEADPALQDAVNVAITLGLPLLITGEPGTGKTELAFSIAFELSPSRTAWDQNLSKPLVFRTKSNSTHTDLFYRYDAMRHFQDAQIRKIDRPVEEYIEYGPLGEAILRASDRFDKFLPAKYQSVPQSRSVVLIDEIDKAPRDLPNDILNELENMSFEVSELRHTFQAQQRYRPILILTSNLERDLPEAFRRRCAFYHIDFPEGEKGYPRLLSIIRKRIPKSERFSAEMLTNAVALFSEVRTLPLEKKPSTAELLTWIDLLDRIAFNVKDGKTLSAQEQDILAASFCLLAKSDDDHQKLREYFMPQKPRAAGAG